ncbi:MAG: hypothetical protein ACTHOG_07875 [Marmoricola sp.]
MSQELETTAAADGVGSVKSDLQLTGTRLQQAQEAAQAAVEEAQRAALEALESGASEDEVARLLGVNPATVREWAGIR